MTDYLVDTNHASKILEREEKLKTRLQEARGTGDTFSISMTILGELYYAAYASRRKKENLARLHNLTILSDNRHLTFVSNLSVDNWLSP